VARKRVVVTKKFIVEGPNEWVDSTVYGGLIQKDKPKFVCATKFNKEDGNGSIEFISLETATESIDG